MTLVKKLRFEYEQDKTQSKNWQLHSDVFPIPVLSFQVPLHMKSLRSIGLHLSPMKKTIDDLMMKKLSSVQ